MEWWVSFLVIISSLFALMFIGLPVAFSFLAVNLIGVYIFFGGTAGMLQLIKRAFAKIFIKTSVSDWCKWHEIYFWENARLEPGRDDRHIASAVGLLPLPCFDY